MAGFKTAEVTANWNVLNIKNHWVSIISIFLSKIKQIVKRPHLYSELSPSMLIFLAFLRKVATNSSKR